MEPPAITRHRRPFLAPVWLSFVAFLVAIGLAFAVYRSATTTVVVLARPAEKELGAIDNPPLSPEGEQRAQRLAQMFGEAKGTGRLDAIYVSDARRAQQTAAPLAERIGKHPIVIPSNDVKSTASRVMSEHEGGTVLVIGNSNTVPQLVRELSGLDVAPLADDEYDTLYIVSVPTFGRSNVLRLKY
jgi:broad specificity phosphatase PhoE